MLCCFCLASTSFAQTSAEPAFVLKPLGHNIWAAIDTPKGLAGANAGFVVGDNGVLVIDSFENADAAQQLLAEIQKITELPVKFVINTHYHLDHVGGNAVFQQAGAVVLAQRNVREWVHTENLKFFGKEIKPEQRALVEQLSAPDVIYDSAVEIYLGTRRVQVMWRLGHTGGDSLVTIPDAGVIFCGDLFWRKTLPNLIDASTGPWMTTLDVLSRSNAKGSYVPGHGDVGNAADVAEFREYLANLRKLVGAAQGEGKSGDGLLQSVLLVLKENYGKWAFFDYFAKKNISDTAAELRGEKKIPRPADIE
jgi:glyoxylase-like metal-dependent hydrolase (beta-lactamase superfamily II)